MNNDAESHLFTLIDEAATWPASERRTRAEEACRGGPVDADTLLAALERSGQLDDFLERPAWEATTDLLEAVEASREIHDWQPGQQVGRYRLVETLGKGGMGQVFLAEQRDPDRRVALKLIRSDGMSAAARERFSVEQQALARLGHPHIAQLYEAGLTDEDTPYFAMEWVDGQPIDAYLEGRPPDLEARLRLFLDVCSAVRHAHQKQVVHRDLKPSNILVSEVDGASRVKVIDFGVAEALDRPAQIDESATSGGIYGTPEFLSPESFTGDVDTRADVYALGVLLYTLVTGTRPFRHASGDVSALIARIRRGEVEPASRVSASSDLPFSSDADRRRWSKRIRGDLESVIAKAMRPARAQRYDSVADLAADVERVLAFEPVSARETDIWHRLHLLSRRRRTLVVAATIGIASILAGAVGTTFGLLRAQREARATRLALGEAEALSTFLTDLFRQSEPNRARGTELSARDLLDQGQARLASEDLAAQPLIRARFSRTIGNIYADLGDYGASEPLLRSALDLYDAQLGPDHPEVATTLHALGTLNAHAGKPTEAAALYEQALAVQSDHPDVAPSDLARTFYHLGVLAFRAEDHEQAEGHFERACPIWEREGTPADRARCLEGFGALRLAQQRVGEAEALILDSLRIREEALGPDHPHVAASLESLCVLARDRLQFERAAAFCQRSLEIRERAFGDQHNIVSHALDRLGIVRRRQQRFDEAEALFQRALANLRTQPQPNRVLETRMLRRLGWVAWLRGHYDAAESHYELAFAAYGHALDAPGLGAGSALLGLGLAAWKQGRLDAAERDLLRVRDRVVARDGAESRSAARVYWGLAGVYRDRADPARGDLARAGSLYRQALDIHQRIYPEGNEIRSLTEDDHATYLARVARQDANAAGS